MTNRIEELFAGLKQRHEKGLITYITAGDPDLSTTHELVLVMAESGADLVEIGVPFSDPVADGPTIQQASQRALAAGTTPAMIIDLVRSLRPKTEIPIVLMTYYNPVYRWGPAAFAAAAAAAGADGLIVPDLPVEEASVLRTACDAHNLALIPLVAPTSTPARIEAIASQARGFIYCVTVTGVTGARSRIETDLAPVVATIRRCTPLPVALGFGIAGPEAARSLAPLADALVVGSALVNLVASHRGTKLLQEVKAFCRCLKEALACRNYVAAPRDLC